MGSGSFVQQAAERSTLCMQAHYKQSAMLRFFLGYLLTLQTVICTRAQRYACRCYEGIRISYLAHWASLVGMPRVNCVLVVAPPPRISIASTTLFENKTGSSTFRSHSDRLNHDYRVLRKLKYFDCA